MRWPRNCLLLIVVGVALLALPQRLEGPPLVPVGVGHALSAVDLVGVLPLVAGSFWLHAGIWARRARIQEWISRAPSQAVVVFGAAGLGLGLLMASALSFFFWWWAVGAAIFALMHVPVLRAARRGAGLELEHFAQIQDLTPKEELLRASCGWRGFDAQDPARVRVNDEIEKAVRTLTDVADALT